MNDAPDLQSQDQTDPRIVVLISERGTEPLLPAVLFELGVRFPGTSAPEWEDRALTALIRSRQVNGLEDVVRRRFEKYERWGSRLCVGQEDIDFFLQSVDEPVLFVMSSVSAFGSSELTGLSNRGHKVVLTSEADIIEKPKKTITKLSNALGTSNTILNEAASLLVELQTKQPSIFTRKVKSTGRLAPPRPGMLSGWAFIEGYDGSTVVQLSVNDVPIANVLADQPRPDIVTRGFHKNEHCGFMLKATPTQRWSMDAIVSARVIGDTRLLTGSAEGKTNRNNAVQNPQGKTLEAGRVLILPQFPRRQARSSLLIFGTSLAAFFRREIKSRFGTFRTGYLWAFLEPVIAVVVMVFIFRGIRGRFDGTLYGEDAIFFFALGVLPYFMFSSALQRAVGAISSGRGLYGFRQVKPIDVVLVRVFLEFFIYGIVSGLFLVLSWWFGYSFTIDRPLLFLGTLATIFWLAFSIGLLFDVITSIYDKFRNVVGVVNRVLFITSGVFYSIDVLPEVIRQYVIWNPLLHAIDRIRESCMEGYPGMGSSTYLIGFTIVSLFLSLAMYRRFLYRLM